MNHELLEQLRDAGFPQNEGSIDRIAEGAPADIPPYTWAYYPALEELIEALGDVSSFSLYNDGLTWSACYGYINATTCRAPSPIEAVARLWLALNPKTA